MPFIGLTALVVHNYDEAINFYVNAVGFELREDTQLDQGKRWVVVAPKDGQTGILLAEAANDEERARVGDQLGGRVGLLLNTDDFERDHARMTAAGVTFEEAPRHEAYGSVAVFRDLYGNRWDLIQPRG